MAAGKYRIRSVGRSALALNPETYIEELGTVADGNIQLADAALALACVGGSYVSVEKYRNHIRLLCDEVEAAYYGFLREGQNESAGLRLQALSLVLCDDHGYGGDVLDYEHIQNASLIRLIDRRIGMPVTLSILYIHVARAQGWNIDGLDIPGRFLCRMNYGSDRVIFDPFNGCRVIEAPDIRFMVKEALGAEVELSPLQFDPCRNREILIRLQGAIKLRQIEAEDYVGALRTVQVMQIFAPDEYRLCLDAGVLYARNLQPAAAIENLERYIRHTRSERERHEATLVLQQIREGEV